MPTALGRGHCGGHITLFFTIEDMLSDPVAQGSRGAGICLKDGVEAIAKGEDGEGKIIVRFQDGDYTSAMYDDVLEELVGEVPEIGLFDWELNIRWPYLHHRDLGCLLLVLLPLRFLSREQLAFHTKNASEGLS